MTMATGMNGADRATLGIWRAANTIGWPLLALGLSLFLRRGFASAAALYGHSLTNVFDWPSYGEYALLVLLPSSILCGCLIGSIVGSRVFWKPNVVALAVSGLFAIVTWVNMRAEPVPHAGFVHWISAGLVALAVLVAGVLALRISRRLPTAPRLDQMEADNQAI
jgi:hypothetical protein